MPGLTFIPGLTPPSARLLEAVGVDKPLTLSEQEPESLWHRLVEESRGRAPGVEIALRDVEMWVENARLMVESCAPARSASTPPGVPGKVSLDDIPEVIVLEEAATPPATAASNRPVRPSPEFSGLAAQRRASDDQGAGRPPTDGDSAAGGEPRSVTPRPQLIASHEPERHNPEADVWKTVERGQFRNFDAYQSGNSGITPLRKDEDPVRGRRIRKADGRQLSRRFARGVPYPRPYLLTLCALMVISWRVLFLVILIGTPLALAPAFLQMETGPLLSFLWVIGAWVVVSLLYLYTATRIRCRVCTNHIFFSKRCFKNVKAHRVRGFGLVGSLALHVILFGWFRCMYCGTAIRVRR